MDREGAWTKRATTPSSKVRDARVAEQARATLEGARAAPAALVGVKRGGVLAHSAGHAGKKALPDAFSTWRHDLAAMSSRPVWTCRATNRRQGLQKPHSGAVRAHPPRRRTRRRAPGWGGPRRQQQLTGTGGTGWRARARCVDRLCELGRPVRPLRRT